MTLRLGTALGAVQIVKGMDPVELVTLLGLTEADCKLVGGRTPWVARDRGTVTRALDTFCAGVLDLCAVARFELPAEYIAAVIYSVVHPINYHTACVWMSGGRRSADDLVQGGSLGEVISAQTLFALLCMLESPERGAFHARFDARVSKKTKPVEV